MKIRSGFVSNSSSSSFIICERRVIKNKEEKLEYLKSHKSCVGYVNVNDGIYFDIEDKLKDEILANFDKVYKCFTISDEFRTCDEDGFRVTEDMVGCDISITTSWEDGYGCPCYLEYDDIYCNHLYTDVLDFLFESLPVDKKCNTIIKLTSK